MTKFFVASHPKTSSELNSGSSFVSHLSVDAFRSYLSIFANIECPLEANVNYSSTMFDLVKNIYKGDILRPSIFGSLGTIAGKGGRCVRDRWLKEVFRLAGLKTADINALSPQLFNFFPSQALARVSPTFLKSLTSDQLQNLNVEQVKTIPNSLLTSLNRQQMGIINQILNPFKTSGSCNEKRRCSFFRVAWSSHEMHSYRRTA